jgi:hypothetical protein
MMRLGEISVPVEHGPKRKDGSSSARGFAHNATTAS